MRFALPASFVALAVLTSATPQPVRQNAGVAIPINKRSGLTNNGKSVDVQALNAQVASTKAYVVFFLLLRINSNHSYTARSFVALIITRRIREHHILVP